jgi:uncharacterized protein (DUF58 family)
MTPYKHTQPGIYSRTTFGALFVLILAAALYLGPGDAKAAWIFGGMAVFMLAGLLMFHSLTVEVIRGSLRIRFGVGLIRRQFRVKDIESAKVVRNRWWYGWGIRITPHGWLFSVSGLDAVQIKLRNGRQYRIGTDQPDALAAAIQAAMPRR